MPSQATGAHDQGGISASERVTKLASDAAGIIREELGESSQVLWFGSWAKGTARPHSDIDLAVIPPKDVTSHDWIRLRERIEEMPTLYSFDLVDLTEASEALRSEIEQHGVPV
jgi:uncharacterized protein